MSWGNQFGHDPSMPPLMPPPLGDSRMPRGASFGNQNLDMGAFPGVQQSNTPAWPPQPAGFGGNSWGPPGPSGPGPGAWANNSPTWANHSLSAGPGNGWTHAQYQPSPPTWTAQTPWSAPAGPTPNWPTGDGSPNGWAGPSADRQQGWGPTGGMTDQPITSGFYGSQPNTPTGAPAAWGNGPGWSSAGGLTPPESNFPALQRSNSQNARRGRRAAIKSRSNSFSGGSPWQTATQLLGGGGNDYSQNNLARRPRDWRADYNPRPGLMSMISPVRGRSDVQEFQDPIRRSLHPLLQYHPTSPPIDHDLRENPFVPDTIQFPNLGREHNQLDLAQMATNPPAEFLRIFHPRFPWYIDIRQSHPNGITVHDVLDQVMRHMYTPITGRHFWNEDLGDVERAAVSAAFQRRCQGLEQNIQQGVMRVDYLGIDGQRFMWIGLKSKNGMWEMKTVGQR